MFEIAAITGLGLLAFFFAYVAFQVEKDKAPLQLLFFCLSLFFVACTLYALSDFSLQSQTPILLNETTSHAYDNGTGSYLLANTTTEYVYGNHTDYSHQQSWYLTLYTVALLLIVFVIFYIIITIIISVFNMFWGKRDDGDE